MCGVPGAGKTWVCEQLKDSFTYVSHDANLGRDIAEVLKNAVTDERPLLLDCPFAERAMRTYLANAGFDVLPYFVVEPANVVKERYLARTGKELPRASATRAVTIANRAIEWNAPRGTSAEVLEMLRNVRLRNSQGTIYYGMHFYPGVAQYQEPNAEPYRVFLNEDTIRAMDPSFAGRPVYVHHVDDVHASVDEVRKDADGWVVESFFNQADGKHWVKFIVCSERGERAIKQGMRLSNCYIPKTFGQGSVWNGVPYSKEILSGEYEHLAIVPNPRYDESVILSPQQFKEYNDSKYVELTRLANNNDEGAEKMAFKLFKRAKVENAVDLEGTIVLLTKSNREVSLQQLCNEADDAAADKSPKIANATHLVEFDGAKMTVADLLVKHAAVCNALKDMKAKENDAGDTDDEAGDDDMANAEDDEDDKKKKKKPEDDDDDMENAEDDEMENAEDDEMENAEDDAKEIEDAKKKKMDAKKNAPVKKKNELTDDELAARRKAREKADRLKDAPSRHTNAVASVETGDDKVARGKSRYGSN